MDRYKPKKLKSPVKAIREHCIECMGGRESEGNVKRISECGSSGCPLYDFRFGKNPYNKKNLSVEERERRTKRMKEVTLRNKTPQKTPKSPSLTQINTKP